MVNLPNSLTSHFVNYIDQMGIDKVGIDKVEID